MIFVVAAMAAIGAWAATETVNGKDGWTFGENWCGVKTYALDKAPDEFTVDSSLKFGKVYGGGMWDGSGYSEREIWEASAAESGLLWPGEKGGEYAFIPVEGSGTITPIIYGDKKYERVFDLSDKIARPVICVQDVQSIRQELGRGDVCRHRKRA